MKNLDGEVIEISRSEVIEGRVRNEAHESELIFVVAGREKRVDGDANVSAEDFNTSVTDGGGLWFGSEGIAFSTSGDEEEKLTATDDFVGGEHGSSLFECGSERIGDQIGVVDGLKVDEILANFRGKA